MSITIVKAGLQTTLQGAPYSGQRHIGMPAAGAADSLSLALANFLVGKPCSAIAIEITLTDAIFTINTPCAIAVVGGAEYVHINGAERPRHQTLKVGAGDTLHIGPSRSGCRTYVAISSHIDASRLLGGQSTYLGAALGGFHGRAFRTADILEFSSNAATTDIARSTPAKLRLHYSDDHVLRVTPGPEAIIGHEAILDDLCEQTYTVGARANRMGLALEGKRLTADEVANMPSAAVFPGTIQKPPTGQPYLLGPDAQTTGGYPRIAQVIRADRHLIGQLGTGARIQFVPTTPERAAQIYQEKLSLLSSWLGHIRLW
ncbi:biotin-dependent carboxyltransferase family protein [Parasphingorhabdus sp.]|uniref:5-oxoprolinase subunit C family protein n=1 Tax=Parasphingorhabdus sp. TaxID=2709688 RepID=UPI003A8E9949